MKKDDDEVVGYQVKITFEDNFGIKDTSFCSVKFLGKITGNQSIKKWQNKTSFYSGKCP